MTPQTVFPSHDRLPLANAGHTPKGTQLTPYISTFKTTAPSISLTPCLVKAPQCSRTLKRISAPCASSKAIDLVVLPVAQDALN
ncbi:hypothetical protein M405DRAFT_833220 [Rhizopogon salebrosus TDB-379]|nr:hypothetical protein M405DRAFT_833220 [Rhizopogon salebrosus TDB-379]